MHRLKLFKAVNLMPGKAKARANAQPRYTQPDNGDSHGIGISGLLRRGKAASFGP